jgi:uncharacterized membrane protein
MSLDSPSVPDSPSQKITNTLNRWFGAFERHWLLVFNTFWGLFVTLPWLAPVFMHWGWTLPGRAIYFMYTFFCHQLPERSWFLFGSQFSYSMAQVAAVWDVSNELVRRQFIGLPEMGWKVAWSDRMVGMYTTIFILGLLYAVLRERGLRFKPMPWWLFLILLFPLALDGTTHLINDALRLDFRNSNQWAVWLTNGIFPTDFYPGDRFGSLNSVLRLGSGFLFGLGTVGFLWPLMDLEFSSAQPSSSPSPTPDETAATRLDELVG